MTRKKEKEEKKGILWPVRATYDGIGEWIAAHHSFRKWCKYVLAVGFANLVELVAINPDAIWDPTNWWVTFTSAVLLAMKNYVKHNPPGKILKDITG